MRRTEVLVLLMKQITSSLETLNELAMARLLTVNLQRVVVQQQVESKKLVLLVLSHPELIVDQQSVLYTRHLESINRLLDRKMLAL